MGPGFESLIVHHEKTAGLFLLFFSCGGGIARKKAVGFGKSPIFFAAEAASPLIVHHKKTAGLFLLFFRVVGD